MNFPKRVETNIKAVDEFTYCGFIAGQTSRFRHVRSLIGLVQRELLAKMVVEASTRPDIAGTTRPAMLDFSTP